MTTSTPEHRDDAKAAVQAECNQVLDGFMDALNAHDASRMDSCMHFPHTRFAGNAIKVYQAAGSNPMDLFTRLQSDDGWSYSRWESRDVIQYNENKAHVALSYTRFRADHSVIGVYESLYVMTRINGRWGIQARSSFGP
jgi:hypothetical protein